MKRRKFIQRMGIGSLFLMSGTFPLKALSESNLQEALRSGELTKLTILHTNDVHSRIEPFPDDGSRYSGRGGAERRAALIQSIREKEENVILLDAGDMWQGTPYFNMFDGEVEYRVMNTMDYDVATLGNHDFDAGLDGLKKQLPKANFDIVSCNYDFSDTQLNGAFKPYKILKRNGIKIGVLGVGIELEGLVGKSFYGETQYQDPVARANKHAEELRDKKCDMVICLSHLGYKYREDKVSDIVLAENSENIDIIIGGHTHTFMDGPDIRKNLQGRDVCIHQVGWAGLLLGRIDIFLEKNTKKKCLRCSKHWVK